MAATTEEDASIVSVLDSHYRVNRLPVLNTKCENLRWKHRSPGSKNVLLIMAWFFLLTCSIRFSLKQWELRVNGNPVKDNSSAFLNLLWSEKAIVPIFIVMWVFPIPIAGLIAEVALSRYKLITYSLWASWILSLFSCSCSVITQYIMVDNIAVLLLVELVLIFGPQNFFLGAVVTCIIPLGMDQIIAGTDANISSFVHWFVWSIFAGLVTPDFISSVILNYTNFVADEVRIIISLIPVLLLSIGLLLDFCFGQNLKHEPVTVNPVTLIFKVLKYAAKHKQPVYRSAFTYCDDDIPSRLDYGKTKYGGPFTTEQVEDVKTFWRVLLVLMVITMFTVSLLPQIMFTENQFKLKSKLHEVLDRGFEPYAMCLYLIPLYELFVYPCLRKRGPTILQSAIIGGVALIFVSLYSVITETILHFVHVEEYIRLFVNIPCNIFLAIALVVLLKSNFEFVCAQAPYNMKGLLTGLSFTAMSICIVLGVLVFWVKSKWLHFNLWFYLSMLILTVVVFVLLSYVVRIYKKRERDEIRRSQVLVEDIYYKYQNQDTTE